MRYLALLALCASCAALGDSPAEVAATITAAVDAGVAAGLDASATENGMDPLKTGGITAGLVALLAILDKQRKKWITTPPPDIPPA